MRKFFAFIIRQSVAVVLITLFILGFGVYSTVNMSVNLLPDINIPVVCVQVVYAGANASTVEKDVTEKVEDGLSSLGGVTDVMSYSYDNLSAVVLYFDYDSDTGAKKNEIQSKLSSVKLPDGVTTSVYDLDLNADALAVLSLTSDKGLEDAHARAKELAVKLSAIDGVESVEIKGGAENAYLIQPFGGLELISPLLVEAYSYGALDLPLGTVDENGGVQIKNESDVTSVDDIKNTPVTLPESVVALLSGIRAGIEAGAGRKIPVSLAPVVISNKTYMAQIKAGLAANETTANLNISDDLIKFILKHEFPESGTMTVKVKDIANITLTPSYGSYAYYFDGGVHISEGIVINIYKSNGANSSKVVKQVKSVYKEVSAEEGYSAEINLLDDQSEFISDSVINVLVSMLIGGVLAIIIIFLFLKKVRTSLVIAITMPLSVLAALICLYLLGVTLNMVSLGGLAVGIGMLVDNSIVVIEAITKHRDGGKSPFDAAVDGTCEVGGALFGSTITTVCVFIPIMFAGGLTAEIFTDLALAVIFSLTFSLLVAVTVIPTLYTLFCGGKRLLKENAKRQKMPAPVKEQAQEEKTEEIPEKKTFREKIAVLKKPVIMDGCTRAYSKILPKVLSHKLVTILVAVVVFGASIGLLFLTGTEFLPSIDKGQIEVTMSYSGASLEEVQDDVLEFSTRITEEVDGIDYLSASVGKQGLLALTDSGLITVQMKSNKNTQKVVNRIRALAEEYKPMGSVTVKEIDGVVASLMSGADDMSVTVIGSDGDTLLQIAEEIGEKLQTAGFTDVKNSAAQKSMQYTLKFDRTALAHKGIDYKTLVMTLRIGIASYTACTVTFGGESYNIDVKFDDNAITSRESLENFVIGFEESTPVLLKDVCTVVEEEKEACIRRSNGNNMISVSAVLPGADTGTASKKMASVASSVLKNYEGYGFEESGITTYLNDAFSGLAVALVISFFLLYAVMAIQFASFVKPIIIMASIPFSFTGGFIALVITGTSLNVVSFIGLIMLMGVVVNNAIVMLEKIKQLKEEMPHFEAVKEACAARLRPIFMTTLTTILALIPMAIGVGQGSELMQPLGIVVIGGLLIGTLVTLLLVPAVYCAIHRLKPPKPEKPEKNNV